MKNLLQIVLIFSYSFVIWDIGTRQIKDAVEKIEVDSKEYAKMLFWTIAMYLLQLSRAAVALHLGYTIVKFLGV
jgi:hypothetical protein